MNDEFNDFIQEHLENLSFVTWDRFVEGEWSEDVDYVTVYGWIDRADSYKDFVEITFWTDRTLWFTTSSSKHTEEIHEILFGEKPEGDHNGCIRVEDHFDIPNKVNL